MTNAYSNRSESPCPSMRAPEWINVDYEHCTHNVFRLLQLELNDIILHATEKMNLEQFVSVYGDFFHHAWGGGACKQDNGWKGNIVYERLMPQWLRGDVVFLYGHNS